MIRLYFNRHGDRPWSLDKGPGSTETTWKTVLFYDAIGHSVYKPLEVGQNPELVPKAWIEFYDSQIDELDADHAEIIPARKN